MISNELKPTRYWSVWFIAFLIAASTFVHAIRWW
jgi:hypothetical protein